MNVPTKICIGWGSLRWCYRRWEHMQPKESMDKEMEDNKTLLNSNEIKNEVLVEVKSKLNDTLLK